MFILLPTSTYGCAIADICFNHNKSKNINWLRYRDTVTTSTIRKNGKVMKTLLRLKLLSNKYIRTDGWLHIFASALICCAFYWLTCWIAPLLSFAVGISKEVYDKISGKGCAELHDLACDALGCFLGFWIVVMNQALM